MVRPVIGITCAIEQAQWGVWDTPVLLSPTNYAAAVQRAGGMAVLLPPDDEVADDPDQVLDMLDALILSGGSDVDPASYGAEPHPETAATNRQRDRFEVALGRAALTRDMPLLGICRGMQMLNVACGGTLEQHLEEVQTHRHTPGRFGDHEVDLAPDSLAARAAGMERLVVKSHHHQGLDRIGDGLVVTGRNPDDGIVEAIEAPEREFALGVLWHPEEDEGSRVIESLIEHARERAERSRRAGGGPERAQERAGTS